MRVASSRASTSPEFMLCTPTGAAWCAASPASQTPPLPKLRARRALEEGERRPVNLRRPRRPPGSPRGDQLLEPLHRWRVSRGVRDLKSPAASPLLEGPVDARQVWIENDAHLGGKLPRRLDLIDGEVLARAVLGHLDAGHPPHGRVVPVGADHIVRSDRLASHDDPLASRDGVAGRDLVELRHLRPEGGVVRVEGLETVPPEDLELLLAERLLGGPLQQALAEDEEIRMLGSEGRIVDLGAPLPSFVVGDLRQLPPRADQPCRRVLPRRESGACADGSRARSCAGSSAGACRRLPRGPRAAAGTGPRRDRPDRRRRRGPQDRGAETSSFLLARTAREPWPVVEQAATPASSPS